MRMIAAHSEVVEYWRGIVGTLAERGLLKQRLDGQKIVPQATGLVTTEYVAFVLDMQRLAGIPKEKWADPALWSQIQAALRGHWCFVPNSTAGLALVVARKPTTHVKRLPLQVTLDLGNLPESPYTVSLGQGKRGPVTLDLAGKHRAILIGGTSGGGKTNLMQAIVLQLAVKHGAGAMQFAIVDTKEVDFGAQFERLPHLFEPIAHDLVEAARLIEAVEQERLRRQAVMASAGVANWQKTDLPLLLLVVDEAADFARSSTMDTLVEVARKGRAFGISVIIGTQNPTSKVIDAQVKANLPTAIAFQTRTHHESGVILGRGGAEKLNRPGLALAFVGGRWTKVQTPLVMMDELSDLGGVAAPPRPTLSDVEQALITYAVNELEGRFIIGTLYDAVGNISKRQLVKLAKQWEMRGWLTEPEHATDPRRVTDELLALCPALDTQSGDRVIGVIGGDRDTQTVIGAVTGNGTSGDRDTQTVIGKSTPQ